MGRIRTIKPEFPHSESIGRLSRDARLLFVQLWTVCDDHGRARAASRMLASLLFPYDDDAPKLIEDWLLELEGEKCIIRYHVEDDTYLEVCNWLKHQKIDHPSASKFPPPTEDSIILASPREKLFRTKDQGPRTTSLVRFTSDAIESIYEAYPRKVGKGAALRAIEKALKRLDTDDPGGYLLQVTKEYAKSPAGNNDNFTPLPATWFNRSSYLDDPKEWEKVGR
jgi:hypothetical protein